MDNKKQQVASSSSSFANDLFGAKDSSKPSAPSTGIFSSIFPPPSAARERNSPYELIGTSPQKQPSVNRASHRGNPDEMIKNRDGVNCNKEKSSIFQERAEPCPLSSSLYYGSKEDMYIKSSGAQTSGSYNNFKRHGSEDDNSGSSSASRGNWWQGSLYY